MTVDDDDFRLLKREVDEIRAQIPPRWMIRVVAWALTLTVPLFVTLFTWLIRDVTNLNYHRDEINRIVTDHRALPIHPGAQEQLHALSREMVEMRVLLREVVSNHSERIANLESGRTTPIGAETKVRFEHVNKMLDAVAADVKDIQQQLKKQ